MKVAANLQMSIDTHLDVKLDASVNDSRDKSLMVPQPLDLPTTLACPTLQKL